MATLPIAPRIVRVLLVDDQPLIRKMVRSVLDQYPRFDVCGEAEDGAEAIEQAKSLEPDVIVLNITMPVMNGFEAAREIKRQLPRSAIVIISTHADRHFVDEAKKIGVHGYVSKSEISETLVEAIEAAVNGDDFIMLQ
jgi:DNA-binding NarL/FixJ family response regulator